MFDTCSAPRTTDRRRASLPYRPEVTTKYAKEKRTKDKRKTIKKHKQRQQQLKIYLLSAEDNQPNIQYMWIVDCHKATRDKTKTMVKTQTNATTITNLPAQCQGQSTSRHYLATNQIYTACGLWTAIEQQGTRKRQ